MEGVDIDAVHRRAQKGAPASGNSGAGARVFAVGDRVRVLPAGGHRGVVTSARPGRLVRVLLDHRDEPTDWAAHELVPVAASAPAASVIPGISDERLAGFARDTLDQAVCRNHERTLARAVLTLLRQREASR